MKRLAITIWMGTLAMTLAPEAAAQRLEWPEMQCQLSTSYYLVRSAESYLKRAATGRSLVADEVERYLRDAHRVLFEALDKGRDDDPAVWYFLGRYYSHRRDLAGADSAWKRAEALAGHCRADINDLRRRHWVPLLNQGVEGIQAGDTESAKRALHRANEIFVAEPQAFFYLGQIYAEADQPDSSIMFYSKAVEIATNEENRAEERFDAIREGASFNMARLYHRAEQYDSAISWYNKFREFNPDDPQAIAGQANAYASAGREAEAIALYDSVLLRAESTPTLDLFATGVVLFRADRFDRAAQAFEAGLERNPIYRDALFNLANTYLRLADQESDLSDDERLALRMEVGEKMSPIARRLVEVDPRSMAALRLLAASFQLQGMDDSTLAVLERAQDLPFDITVSSFQPGSGDAWNVRGLIQNNGDEPVTVPTIVFEFLTEAGEVVTTSEIAQQTMEVDGMASFSLDISGEGIAAWRYRINSE